MREIGLEGADLSRTFEDINSLSDQCKFNDCTHTSEPKCAVRSAIEKGALSQERYDNYVKLKREAKYDGLGSKQIEQLKLTEMYKGHGGIKNARKMQKRKKYEKER